MPVAPPNPVVLSPEPAPVTPPPVTPVSPISTTVGASIPVIEPVSPQPQPVVEPPVSPSIPPRNTDQGASSTSSPLGTQASNTAVSESPKPPVPPTSPTEKPTDRNRFVAGYVIAALLAGIGGGYGAGRIGSSSAKTAEQQLQAEVARTKDASADSQTKASKIASDLADEKQKEQKAEADLAALQNNLDQLQKNLTKATGDRDRNARQVQTLQDSLTAAQARQRDLESSIPIKIKQAEAAQAQRVQQLTNQLRDSQNELASLKKKAPTNSGFLVWVGDLKGKKTIEIKDGVPSMGTLSTGALPGKPCTVTPADPSRVKIKNKPEINNHWGSFSFETSGNGPTEVRIYWTLL
jgi:hypothetical protein